MARDSQLEGTLVGDTFHVEGTFEEDILAVVEGIVLEDIHGKPLAHQHCVLGGQTALCQTHCACPCPSHLPSFFWYCQKMFQIRLRYDKKPES